MKKTLFGLLLMMVVLSGCATDYESVLLDCNAEGSTARAYGRNGMGKTLYTCMDDSTYRSIRFNDCSYSCERAIDDNRDLTLTNSSTETLGCLKLCMSE